jgi:hypothetical protein
MDTEQCTKCGGPILHRDILCGCEDAVETSRSDSGGECSTLGRVDTSEAILERSRGLPEASENEGWGTSLELPRGPAGLLYLDRSQLSRGFLKRIERKYNLAPGWDKEKPVHHMTRKKIRRDAYHRWEGGSKRREREDALKSTPEGLWKWYKWYSTTKGFSWEISLEEWMGIMTTLVNGAAIAYYDFYIYRIDKSIKIYNIYNIYIVDRYTKELLYKL